MSPEQHVPAVALVDAHPSVLMSTAMVLEQEGIKVAAATPDLRLAERLCDAGRVNVIVIDPHVVAGATRSTIAGLALQFPGVAIVVMSMERSPAFVRVAIRAGATGFVHKSQADTELAVAVRLAAQGQSFISPDVASAQSPAGSSAAGAA